MRIGSLFAGIGGFDLAAQWMGWETAWYSEIDPFCNGVMAHHFPEATALGDITKIDWGTVEPVNLVCGGFPCQDVSQAGKRAGISGVRSGLWIEYARAIRDLRPRYVVVENVPGLLIRGLDAVLRDLAALGYDAEWQVLSAADVGAPHLRERVWIVAYPNRDRKSQSEGRITFQRRRALNRDQDVAYAHSQRRKASWSERDRNDAPVRIWDGRPEHLQAPPVAGRGTSISNPTELGDNDGRRVGGQEGGCHEGRFGAWLSEPDVGRMAHGVSNRLAQLCALGNAIVPQCAYRIFQAIEAAENMTSEKEAER